MKKLLSLLLLLALGCGTVSAHDFKIEKGQFVLDGKPITLVCGEMHYPRIPQEYWRDRLLRAKAMGLNCISTYVFWNIHERQPGKFDLPAKPTWPSLYAQRRNLASMWCSVPAPMYVPNGTSAVSPIGCRTTST